MVDFIRPSFTLADDVNGQDILSKLERAGRVAYQSTDRITGTSAGRFVQELVIKGHESVLEHVNVSARVVTDRGVLAELTRHRIGSFTVESTRYVNYRMGIEVIDPFASEYVQRKIHPNKIGEVRKYWLAGVLKAESAYATMITEGAPPEIARGVLPLSLKTEIYMTFNLRQWRYFIKLRSAKEAHPQMRELADTALEAFRAAIPIVFDDM